MVLPGQAEFWAQYILDIIVSSQGNDQSFVKVAMQPGDSSEVLNILYAVTKVVFSPFDIDGSIICKTFRPPFFLCKGDPLNSIRQISILQGLGFGRKKR